MLFRSAKVEDTAAWLTQEGFTALPYHAGLSAELRTHHQNRFLREDGVIVVATIAFGMGIDKPDVRFVAHVDLPKSLEAYYQETGRAGRDGLAADTLTLYGMADMQLRRAQIEQSDSSDERKRVERQRLNALLALAEAPRCRRQTLLAYFAEPSEPCGNCDLCQEGVERFDGTIEAQKAMSAIVRTGERFGMEHVVAILTGERTVEGFFRTRKGIDQAISRRADSSRDLRQALALHRHDHAILRPEARGIALRRNLRGVISFRCTHAKPVRAGSWIVMQFFRNSPWLVLLFYCMFLLPFKFTLFGVVVPLPDWAKATLGLTLPVIANMSEIVRGAIHSIPTGQWESAASFAFSRRQTLWMIILPQCVKRMLPPWMNLYSILTVGTVLVSVVGVSEVMTLVGDVLGSEQRSELLMPFYFYILIWFFLYCYPIARWTVHLERKYAVNQ